MGRESRDQPRGESQDRRDSSAPEHDPAGRRPAPSPNPEDGRIGRKKAAVAVGHSILVIAWHLLAGDCDYHDLGGDWFVRRSDHDHRKTHLVKQLQALGYSVTLQPAA